MAAFNFHRRKTRRWWYAGATLVAAALFAVFYVAGASATLSGSPYNGSDGVPDSGNGISATSDVTSGTSDNSFGQGSKEDSPNVSIVTGSIPPNKNDLTQFSEGSTSNGTGVFLYLGWSRAVNIGNANLDFEINKKPSPSGCDPTALHSCWDATTTGSLTINRSAGDVLVTYDFGGSGTPTLGVNRWLTGAHTPDLSGSGFATNTCLSANAFPCWGDHVDLTTGPGGDSEAAVSSNGLFGEAAINLTAAGVVGSGSCDFGQATTFLKSRSSSSFTAELKDFIAPVSTPINPCASITIIKHTLQGDGITRGVDQSFSYHTGTGLSDFSLNDKTGSDVTCTGSNTCNKEVFTGLGPGSYSVTETLTNGHPASGFDFKDLTCSASGSGTSVSPSANPGGNSTSTATITLNFAGSVTCTYTNQRETGAILITKTGKVKNCTAANTPSLSYGVCTGPNSANLGGASFSVTSGGTAITGSPFTTSNSTGTVCIDGLALGNYVVTETAAPAGYSIDNTSAVTVSVSANGTCNSGHTAIATGASGVVATNQTGAGSPPSFADTPLTTLEVIATGEAAAGSTKSTITCTRQVSGSAVTVGTPISTPADPADWKTQHLKPDTYTCTVVIDP